MGADRLFYSRYRLLLRLHWADLQLLPCWVLWPLWLSTCHCVMSVTLHWLIWGDEHQKRPKKLTKAHIAQIQVAGSPNWAHSGLNGYYVIVAFKLTTPNTPLISWYNPYAFTVAKKQKEENLSEEGLLLPCSEMSFSGIVIVRFCFYWS